MPTHPPDDLTEVRDIKLWRDLTRMFEDYSGNDETVWPERQESFVRIVRQVIEPLISDHERLFAAVGSDGDFHQSRIGPPEDDTPEIALVGMTLEESEQIVRELASPVHSEEPNI